MSRGPGRWQRLLLQLVSEYHFVPIIDVVESTTFEQGREATRADHVAARRAAKRIAEDGKARAIYLWRCNACGKITGGYFCCGRLSYALALTKDPDLPSALLRNMPEWISVASDQLLPEATLRHFYQALDVEEIPRLTAGRAVA
jgi:hypothetical protein